MKKHYLFIVSLWCLAFQAMAQPRVDTLKISDLFTTHIIFNTDLIYADLSNSQVMAAKILDQSKNMITMHYLQPIGVQPTIKTA